MPFFFFVIVESSSSLSSFALLLFLAWLLFFSLLLLDSSLFANCYLKLLLCYHLLEDRFSVSFLYKTNFKLRITF